MLENTFEIVRTPITHLFNRHITKMMIFNDIFMIRYLHEKYENH